MSALRSVFGAYVRRRIGRGLDGLWVRGLDRVREELARGPVVLAATHVGWWDGMVLFPLDDALGRTTRAWMDAENLRRLPFFAPLGALPLDRSSPAALLGSTRTALRWLDQPGRALWVFPQGRHRPPWVRPLDLAPGAERVAKRANAVLVPVGLQYVFREAPVPACVVSFGPALVDPAGDALEHGIVAELAATDRFALDGPEGFEPLVPSRVGRTDRGWAARALGWLVGGRR